MSGARGMWRAMGIGACLMYLFDPSRGRRRRALIRDQIVQLKHRTQRALGVGCCDLQNRVEGLAAEVVGWLGSPKTSDDILMSRVRSAIGHVILHPGAIGVAARDGTVTLTGPIFNDEVERLLAAVAKVRGVNRVENQLAPHGRDDVAGISALQGGGATRQARGNWPPAARLLAGMGLVWMGRKAIGRRTAGLLLDGLGGYMLWQMLNAGSSPGVRTSGRPAPVRHRDLQQREMESTMASA